MKVLPNPKSYPAFEIDSYTETTPNGEYAKRYRVEYNLYRGEAIEIYIDDVDTGKEHKLSELSMEDQLQIQNYLMYISTNWSVS
jgi:hypothetical protein